MPSLVEGFQQFKQLLAEMQKRFSLTYTQNNEKEAKLDRQNLYNNVPVTPVRAAIDKTMRTYDAVDTDVEAKDAAKHDDADEHRPSSPGM